jgi:hypothetical protein
MPRFERMTDRLGPLRRGKLVVASVLVGLGALGVFAVTHASGGSTSGGVSAGVAAMADLPPVASLSPDVQRWVESSAAAMGTDPVEARARVRTLRTGLGATHSDVYAYTTATGATCFDVTEQAALCPRDAAAGPRGIQWLTGGGFGAVARNVVGLVSDDVARVDLSVGGSQQAVPVRNNTIFAELPAGSAEASLLLSFRDGEAETIVLPGER